MSSLHQPSPVDRVAYEHHPALEGIAVEPQKRLALLAKPGTWVLVPLVLVLVLWLWLFSAEGAFRGGPAGVAFGSDFAMFVGAAQILHDGGNPYNHQLLYATEKQYLASQHLKILKKRSVVRVGNPPLFFWALAPLSGRQFQPLSWLWSLFLYAVSGLGFLALLRYAGWKRWRLPLLLFLLMPQVVLGPFYGNVAPIVFAGIAGSLWLGRRHPVAAGALMTVAWLKPQIALPAVALIVLFHCPRRLRAIQGFAATSALLLVMTLITTGPSSVVQWTHGLFGYSRDVASSPDLASLAGLYVRVVRSPGRTGIEIALLAIAIAVTGVTWYRYRDQSEVPMLSVSWLWVLWFLATPYAHFYDEILLVIPLLALFGLDGRGVSRREAAAVLYLAFGCLLVISAVIGGVQMLWLPIAIMMVILYRASVNSRYRPFSASVPALR
ncbi:MAG: glycosyltransferase family 87 protein [Chloroflexota bacterium]